jgi:hypothetical protein
VPARHPDIAQGEEVLLAAVPPHPGRVVAEEGPVSLDQGLPGDAERQEPPPGPPGLLEHHRIVGVHHRPVRLVLLREDPGLRGRIGLEGGVSVQVVGGEVEPDRHLGAEAGNALELEARHLDREDRGLRRALDETDEGRPDVPAHAHVHARLPQHRAESGGRGRLALGPGDRDEAAPEVSERELDLGQHLRPPVTGGFELGALPRHPGRHHDHRGAGKRLRPVPPEIESYSERPQAQRILRKLRFALEIRRHHRRPPPGEKLRRRDPRTREPDDHDGHPLQSHGVLITSASAS